MKQPEQVHKHNEMRGRTHYSADSHCFAKEILSTTWATLPFHCPHHFPDCLLWYSWLELGLLPTLLKKNITHTVFFFSYQIIIHPFSPFWSIFHYSDAMPLPSSLRAYGPAALFKLHNSIFMEFYFSSSSPLLHNTLQAVEVSPTLCPESLCVTIDSNLVLLNHSSQHLLSLAF